jgi:pimeloyl-ACP methyl ester carboxylesterase
MKPWIIVAIVLVVAAAVFSALVLSAYWRDIRSARARVGKIPSKVYESKYGDIEYLIAGEGPTVLISHGVTGGIDQGMQLAGGEFDQFGKGYRFLYVSRFGYLKSALPENASARLQAAAYKELLDHLGGGKIFVYGNSAGAPSAMWFAADYSDRTRGLILSSSAVPQKEPPAPPPAMIFRSDFVYWAIVKAAPSMLLDIFVPKSIRLTPEERSFFIKNAFEWALPVSVRSQGILFDNGVSTPSVNEVPFEKIMVPTLIVHAVDDPAPPIEGAREIARRVANSRLVELDGGHLLVRHDIRPVVRQFLSAND